MANKRVWNALLGCNLKNDRMTSFHFQGKPFNITVIQAYAPTSNAEEAEVEQFYEDLQDLLELTPSISSIGKTGEFPAKEWNWTIPDLQNPTPDSKINLKWINDLNVRLKIMKLLEGNIGGKLLDIGLGDDFFNLIPRAKSNESRNKKVKKAKERFSQQRKHFTEWKGNLQNDYSSLQNNKPLIMCSISWWDSLVAQ